MSRSPDVWPESEDEDKEPVIRVDDNYVSEFLSERSPEFEAVRKAAADARQEGTPTPPARTAARPTPGAVPAVSRAVPWSWLVGAAGVTTAVVAIAWLIAWPRSTAPAVISSGAPAPDGMATIISQPAGAEVLINGVTRGETPLQLSMPAGTYMVQLRGADFTRDLTLTVDAGRAVREVVDLTPVVRPARLEVTSDVAGARVSIDGVPGGVTPLVVDGIEPGTHQLAISSGGETVYRRVTVEAGATASVMASVVPSGATGGWLTFSSPIEMQVIEDGQVLGTTAATRLMLPAGPHRLELVAEAHEFRTTVSTTVGGGRTVNIPVTVPDGRLSINAVPWADVWVSGRALGSTPLANLALAVGDHEVVWRHPELGERRQTVRVVAETPVRVSVDLNR